jgi:hypothetical protein
MTGLWKWGREYRDNIEKLRKNNRNIRNEQIKSIIGFRPKDYYGQDGVDSWYDYLPAHVLHPGSRLWLFLLFNYVFG